MRDGKEKVHDCEPERQRPLQYICRIRYPWRVASENANRERGLHLPGRKGCQAARRSAAMAITGGRLAAYEKHGRGQDGSRERYPARWSVFRFHKTIRCARTEGERECPAMTEWSAEEPYQSLAEHRLGRSDLLVKLDRGFEQGVYGICIDYGLLAERVGFTAARRQALDYAVRLHGQLTRVEGYAIDDIEDDSRDGGPGRKRDLECRFLLFALTSEDGRWHDDAIKERFRIALLRAGQESDQHQAGVDERRKDERRERFRERLETLLAGDAYRQMDGVMKERLLAEVTALAFPPKGREL